MMDDSVSLAEALAVVKQTIGMIAELESMLQSSSNPNFRERLVHELEHGNADAEFRQKAHRLLSVYRDQFGVKDLMENLKDDIDDW